MKPEQLAKEVKNALGQNDFEHALQLLEDHGPTAQIRREAILLKGDWHDINRKERLRLLDNTNIGIEQGILRNSIFDLADLCLKKPPVIPSSPSRRLLFFLPMGMSLLVYLLSATALLNAPLEKSTKKIDGQTRSYLVVVRPTPASLFKKIPVTSYSFETSIRGGFAQGVISYDQIELNGRANTPNPSSEILESNRPFQEKRKVQFFSPGLYDYQITINCDPEHELCDPESELLYSGIFDAQSREEPPYLNFWDQIYIAPFQNIIPLTLFIYVIFLFRERFSKGISYLLPGPAKKKAD